MKQEYMEAFTEVDEILKLMPINLLNKIPNKFKEIVKSEKSKEYFPTIEEPIEDCKLKEETIIILALIYRDFLCDENQRRELKARDAEELKKFEEELREKYNPDNLFKKNKEKIEENNQETAIVEYKEQSFIRRLFERIKNIFKRK